MLFRALHYITLHILIHTSTTLQYITLPTVVKITCNNTYNIHYDFLVFECNITLWSTALLLMKTLNLHTRDITLSMDVIILYIDAYNIHHYFYWRPLLIMCLFPFPLNSSKWKIMYFPFCPQTSRPVKMLCDLLADHLSYGNCNPIN